MIRTQIQLDGTELRRARLVARQRGISFPQLVRVALARETARTEESSRTWAERPPAFLPAPLEAIANHDRGFVEAIEDSKRP